MASTSDFRNGLCIEFNNDLYTIVQFQHVKPGKGPAFVRTKLKNVTTGKVIDNTFTAGHKITIARVERRPHQFLYKDDVGYHFMHTETYEQLSVEESMIEQPLLLKESMIAEIVVHADNEAILSVELPAFVEMEVTYTEPGIKGDTSSGSASKPATIETGLTVYVPLFINQGYVIKVDTRDGSYSERVKK